MMTVLHLGGNGHCEVRLEAARRALAGLRPDVEIVDVAYPGFEGRPPAGTLDGFLAYTAESCRRPAALGVATGVGALIALCLRARGELDIPLIFQGPVLWGLERRSFPRILRRAFARRAAQRLFQFPLFQELFVRKYFVRRPDAQTRMRFFRGYKVCFNFPQLFEWLTPSLLRDLEQRFAARPEALARVTVWCGDRDRVVGPDEVRVTTRALQVNWPIRYFPAWGHYPALDAPEEWAEALLHDLAAVGTLSRPGDPEAP